MGTEETLEGALKPERRKPTFAFGIFYRLLLFHFLHVFHIGRVHLSLVFAVRGGGGDEKGKVSQTGKHGSPFSKLTHRPIKSDRGNDFYWHRFTLNREAMLFLK